MSSKNLLVRPPDEYIQRLVCDTVIQRLPLQVSLKYINQNLKREGKKEVSRTKLIRVRRYMKDHQFDRLFEIAKEGFVSQHLARIDDLELIKLKMWKMVYKLEKHDPFKAAQVLVWLMQVQPYLSQYYEASKFIMRKVAEENKRNANGQVSMNAQSDYIP